MSLALSPILFRENSGSKCLTIILLGLNSRSIVLFYRQVTTCGEGSGRYHDWPSIRGSGAWTSPQVTGCSLLITCQVTQGTEDRTGRSS